MSVARSPPPQESSEANCLICKAPMIFDSQECYIIAICNHIFHRHCIESTLSQSAECPNCRRPCELADLRKYCLQTFSATNILELGNSDNNSLSLSGSKSRPVTRSKARGALAKRYNTRNMEKNFPMEDNPPNMGGSTPHDSPPFSHDPTVNFTQVQTRRFQADTNNNLPSQATPSFPRSNRNMDYARINQMIESSISRALQNLNLSSTNQNQSQVPSPRERNIFSGNNHSLPNNLIEESNSFRSEKVTSIIQNWHIKFDGSANGLSVEEFLYRVRSLTRENFNNDFNLICKNLHMLLTGKARDWFWRYHKQVDSVQWSEFCSALRYQYKDFRSSFDIREEIRNRKMKSGESFESFYESVCSILDRLETPMAESELVEILVRNLRADIRHELLYVPIYSIAHLRKLVQMRENLLGEDFYRRGSAQRNHAPLNIRKVADIATQDDMPNEFQVDAMRQSQISVKCWNCDDIGHFWEDCLKDRTIFCYGCGAKNVYKPQCTVCASKKLQYPKNQYSPPTTHPPPRPQM